MFILPKTLRNCKDKPKTVRKYLKTKNLIKDLYPDYVKKKNHVTQ